MTSEEIASAQASFISFKNSQKLEKRYWWLLPRPFDLVSSLMYLFYLILFVIDSLNATPLSSWQKLLPLALAALCVLCLLAIDRWEYRTYSSPLPRRVAIWFWSTRLALIEVLCLLDSLRYSPFLYLILLFLGCIYFGELSGFLLCGLAIVVYILKHSWLHPLWYTDGTELHYLVIFTVGCVFAITIARVVLRERASHKRTEELLAELEESHRQLRAYADQVGELATIRERNRLAREIHDCLGHYLTVINIQLEKARLLGEYRRQEADQAISAAKRLASEALQDVRRSVGALRTNQELPAFLPSLKSLVEHTESAQLSIEVQISGQESNCSPASSLTLYRIVQEGLTNVQKHAHASQVHIEVSLESEEVRLSLRDNGCGFEPDHLPEDRYGLRGLEERLELLGGSLSIKSGRGQGTSLSVWIPGSERSHPVRTEQRRS